LGAGARPVHPIRVILLPRSKLVGFEGKADIQWQAGPADSVENNSKATFVHCPPIFALKVRQGQLHSVGRLSETWFDAMDRTSEGRNMNPAPVKPVISTSDLDKIDIRVGTILAVEDVMQSETLVRLRVDFGDHARSILVGMKKERQNPKAEIEGKQALFVVNLEPRKMAGEISEGMIFDLGYADGITPVLALPEKPVPDGTRAG
jgi:methionine--tRNA ligase beta chain